MKSIPADDLREIGMQLFTACGAPPGDVKVLVDHLVDTSLMGLDSHGVMRYGQYIDGVFEGKIKPGAPVCIIKETASTAVVDCGFNFGQVGAKYMTGVVCQKAKQANIACVVSENCNHIGRLGAYTQEIAENNLVGFGVANSSKHGHWVVPYGGREGRLATNPISFAVPSKGTHPMVLDMSTAMISEGKIRATMYQGKSIPQGFILDAAGNGVTNPADFYGPPKGTILPLGSPYHGYKGFGLSLLVEILAGVMGGNSTAEDLPYINGLCLIAINPEVFAGTEIFKGLIDEMSEYMKSSLPAVGHDQVVLPGELDFETYEKRSREGIPVDENVWQLIQETARKLGVPVPDFNENQP